MGGSQDVIVLGQMAVFCASDAEVHHLDVAVGQHHDVLRLDVAVNDFVFMGYRQGAANLRTDLGDLFRVKGAMAFDAALEVGTAQILHDDVVGVAIFTPVVDTNDIRARKPGCCLCLLLESGCKCGVACILRQHDFDCDGTVEALVLRAVNGGHATGSDFILNEVPSPEDPLLHNCS